MAPASLALPSSAPSWSLSFRAFQCWLTVYRRIWRSSIWSSVLGPICYIGALGFGLGTLVDKHGTASLGGVSYLVFLAPGLLAASAMGTGVGESTYPVLGSVPRPTRGGFHRIDRKNARARSPAIRSVV